MELLVLGAYLQDGQAWTVAWKCLIPNNYSFLNISLSPTGNFWWFHCVSQTNWCLCSLSQSWLLELDLWNSKRSWLQKIRKQLHSKPDFLFLCDCLGIIVQLYVVRKLGKCGFQISLCFPVSQIWKVWCHFWNCIILQIYFWNMKHRYLTQNKLWWRSKECSVQIWSCIDIPTLSLEKPYTYSCRCQWYRLWHKNLIIPGRLKAVGMKFRSVRVMSNFAKPLVEHVFSNFEVNIYRVTTTFPRPWFLSWTL